ncbi:unnamed protein product [Closterium sp. Yama58-4]|nr:unnamed protein product [Closterium sp. Yama58-4]
MKAETPSYRSLPLACSNRRLATGGGGALLFSMASGHRVWALTLPGFGRAEKPFWSYTQYVWRDCVGDFIREVVGEPVVLGGNSIGGYTVSSVAAQWPALVSSLVLFNSAGRIDPDIPIPTTSTSTSSSDSSNSSGPSSSSLPSSPPDGPLSKGPPKPVAWLLSRALFLYLRFNTGPILKRCYPVRPERADDWLLGEISRAATDPGAVEVVESAFYLPKPEPLNSLLIRYGGPVLVLQGSLDPLNDAVARANLITATCPGVALKLLKAGHCPHDEVPEQVAYHMDQWARATWCSVADEEGDQPMGAQRAAAAARSPADALEILEEEAAVGVFGGMMGGGKGVGKKASSRSVSFRTRRLTTVSFPPPPPSGRRLKRALVTCDAAQGNAPGGENGAAKANGGSGDGAEEIKDVRKGGAKENAAVANGRESRQEKREDQVWGRQEKREDQVWGRRRLSDLEREILGVQRGDGVLASPKGGASAPPRGSAPPPPSARPQLRRRDPNSNQKSILDELDEQGFGQLSGGVEEWEAVKSAKRVGEWLEEKTIRKEGEDEMAGPPLGFSLVLLLGIFPVWLFLVLVAGGWVELPPQLSSLQDLLTTP